MIHTLILGRWWIFHQILSQFVQFLVAIAFLMQFEKSAKSNQAVPKKKIRLVFLHSLATAFLDLMPSSKNMRWSSLNRECLLFQDSDGIIYLRGCTAQKCSRSEPPFWSCILKKIFGTWHRFAVFSPKHPNLLGRTTFDVFELGKGCCLKQFRPNPRRWNKVYQKEFGDLKRSQYCVALYKKPWFPAASLAPEHMAGSCERAADCIMLRFLVLLAFVPCVLVVLLPQLVSKWQKQEQKRW